MSYPKRVSIPVYGTKYHLEVDVSKWDCKREPAHCHVYAGSRRIAQVWLDSCTFEDIPREVSHNDQSRILDAVSSNRYELNSVYDYNRDYGAD